MKVKLQAGIAISTAFLAIISPRPFHILTSMNTKRILSEFFLKYCFRIKNKNSNYYLESSLTLTEISLGLLEIPFNTSKKFFKMFRKFFKP